MIMTKEVFQEKIEAGETVVMGRYSCQLWEGDFYFHGEETEVFKSFEELWGRVHSFILCGVGREGNTE